MNSQEFESFARRRMSDYLNVTLSEGRPEGFPKRFDMLSPDGAIVGDAKFFTLVRRKYDPPAKFSVIAEYVWLMQCLPAERRFLVFGEQREVPERWLAKYGNLVETVEFYFLSEGGVLEKLA